MKKEFLNALMESIRKPYKSTIGSLGDKSQKYSALKKQRI